MFWDITYIPKERLEDRQVPQMSFRLTTDVAARSASSGKARIVRARMRCAEEQFPCFRFFVEFLSPFRISV